MRSMKNYYMKQLLEIDKLIQYVYDMRHDQLKQRLNVDDTPNKLLEITKQQLNDSNELNQRLLAELREKTQENQRRNGKFNQILSQIKQLESQVKQYQVQMNDITTQLMNIRQNLNEAIDGHPRSETPIKSMDRSNLNSFRNHFNTTPPKKSRDDEQIKSTSYKKETPKQKKEQIEKIYKQLFRKYY